MFIPIEEVLAPIGRSGQKTTHYRESNKAHHAATGESRNPSQTSRTRLHPVSDRGSSRLADLAIVGPERVEDLADFLAMSDHYQELVGRKFGTYVIMDA